jgi:hypothetical protein
VSEPRPSRGATPCGLAQRASSTRCGCPCRAGERPFEVHILRRHGTNHLRPVLRHRGDRAAGSVGRGRRGPARVWYL